MRHIKYHELLNEYLHIYEAESGIKCYVVPKQGFQQKQAMIAVNYGGIDNEFEVNGVKHKMPAGLAHFLEHKLFEDEKQNIFQQFSSLGATANAFTSFTNTAYYFSCAENFEDNFKLLLDFVQTPYFTDENVEKEKGIITQEININDDDPSWTVYINMLTGLYHNKDYRQKIAGTVSSIKKIDKDMLLECYNKFYTPRNMAVVCCGDLDEETIFRIVDEKIESKPYSEIKRIVKDEPEKIHKRSIKEHSVISTPLFYFGFKDNDRETPIMQKTAAIKVLLDILSGQSSSFYTKMYAKGLIDGRFSAEYVDNTFFANSIFFGFSKDWEEVKFGLLQEIDKLKKNGIDDQHFERIKNKHIGRFIRGFNDIDSIVSTQVDYFSKGTDLFEVLDIYKKLQKDTLLKFLASHLKEENMTSSIVTPEKNFFWQ